MSEIEISLDSVDKVKQFVSIVAKFDTEMDLISGRYVINAKSIMGIFCMGLSEHLFLRINDDGEKVVDILNAIRDYVVV